MNSYELARYRAGLALNEAAKRSTVHERTILRLESGEIEKPQAPVARALADTYGVPVEVLLGVQPAEPEAAA